MQQQMSMGQMAQGYWVSLSLRIYLQKQIHMFILIYTYLQIYVELRGRFHVTSLRWFS